MRITLVPDVPDQLVAWGVEDSMDRDGQFNHAQTGAQMPTGNGNRRHCFGAQLVRHLTQLAVRQAL